MQTQWGMFVSYDELKPSIERIMKLPYFDGLNQAQPRESLKYLMHHDCYDYVLLLIKCFDKNSMIFQQDHPLIAMLKTNKAHEKWLMRYFNMLEKWKMIVPQDILKKAFELIDSIQFEETVTTVKRKEERKKCKAILKLYLSKNVN